MCKFINVEVRNKKYLDEINKRRKKISAKYVISARKIKRKMDEKIFACKEIIVITSEEGVSGTETSESEGGVKEK